MIRHDAPTPEPDETDLNYIVRVCNWLAEPDRRRLGVKTRQFVIEAAKRLDQGDTWLCSTCGYTRFDGHHHVE